MAREAGTFRHSPRRAGSVDTIHRSLLEFHAALRGRDIRTLAVDFPPSSSIIRLTLGLVEAALVSAFTGTTTSVVGISAIEGAIFRRYPGMCKSSADLEDILVCNCRITTLFIFAILTLSSHRVLTPS